MELLERNKMKIIDSLKNYWWLLTIIFTIISGIWGVSWSFKENSEEMLTTLKTTQQMALKSVIWNEHIPLDERASACDVYIAAGYNSFTKKECEIILDEGAEEGTFFNLGRSE